jgi:RNA polymerase primary sigma factor
MGVSVIESGSDTDIETEGEATTGTERKEKFAPENQLAVFQQRTVSTTRSSKPPAERTDDPLRVYLRDMGSMELLSRARWSSFRVKVKLQSPSGSRPAARL